MLFNVCRRVANVCLMAYRIRHWPNQELLALMALRIHHCRCLLRRLGNLPLHLPPQLPSNNLGLQPRRKAHHDCPHEAQPDRRGAEQDQLEADQGGVPGLQDLALHPARLCVQHSKRRHFQLFYSCYQGVKLRHAAYGSAGHSAGRAGGDLDWVGCFGKQVYAK